MKTRTKVILSTLLALLLLAATIAAGLNAVFTVTYIRTDFATFSAEGNRDAAQLSEELDKFVGKSTTFLDLDKVRETVEKYPHFVIEHIGKKFPSTVELSLSERREEYAFEKDGKYAFLDAEGKFLTEGNPDLTNRAGGQNILLTGFSLSILPGGEVEGRYFPELLTVMETFKRSLPGIRANVLSVELDLGTTDLKNVIFRIRMKEGVMIVIHAPSRFPAEKAAMAISDYLALKDEERLFGLITAYETVDGELRSAYSRQDLSN